MKSDQITIQVDPQTAEMYRTATDDQRRKIDMLLRLRIRELSLPARPLDEVIRDVSASAKARGLTPEILESILNGR